MRSENKVPGAIILGGSFHSLGAARNLAKYGVPVCILESGISITQFSRHVKRFKCPPIEDEREFVNFLIQFAVVGNKSGWALFPSTDEYVRVVSQHRECLRQYYGVTTPAWVTIKYLYDKRLTSKLAKERKIPIPETWNPTSLDDLSSLNLEFPVVLKPAISKRFLASTKKKAYRANDRQELINLYKKMAVIIDPSQILIQELILGRAENLFSFVGFFKDGLPIAGLTARRSRQHPMEFGRASTFVEIVNAPELKDLATELLHSIAYTGLAEVEFMYDQKDGRYEFLEVNPRIWGWHSIAVRAGLDLPYIAYADTIGQEFMVKPARGNVKWVRLVTDVPVVIQEILSGNLTVWKYLDSMSGDIGFAVLSLRDPLPFIADLLISPYNYLRGRGF